MPEAVKQLCITFVIPYFYPAWEYGGQPRSAYELARALAQRGHRVKVLTTDSGGRSRLQQTGRRQVDGVEIVYYPNISNRLAYRYRVFSPRRMFREIQSEIAASDVVHIHELRSSTSVFAYHAACRAAVPYVLSGHGGLRRLGRSFVKAIYDALWGRRILRDAAAVIAISPSEAADARAMGVGSHRIQSLPNIVRSDDFQLLPASGAFRRRWSLPAGPIVLFLGRLHSLKGADLLVQAFSRVSDDLSQASVVIAGPDDGQESELRRIISKLNLHSRVRLIGFLDLELKKESICGRLRSRCPFKKRGVRDNGSRSTNVRHARFIVLGLRAASSAEIEGKRYLLPNREC